jgi:hypothetical protein
MGAWFRQLLQEGLAVAALVTLLIVLPWWPAKLFVAALLLWILLLYWRDPKVFYRRMFRLAVGAILAAPLSSFFSQTAGPS